MEAGPRSARVCGERRPTDQVERTRTDTHAHTVKFLTFTKYVDMWTQLPYVLALITKLCFHLCFIVVEQYTQKNITDFHESLWRGGAWPKEEPIKCGFRGRRRNSFVAFFNIGR